MKTWVRRSLNVGVLGAGFLLVSGAAAAQADQVSGPNAGLVSGNQLSSVLQMPIDISGNAVSVLGFADAQSGGGAAAVNTESASATEAGQVSGFNSGILSGNQVSSVVQVPVSVCGNAIAVLGFANASCAGGAGAFNGGGGGGGWGGGSGNGGSHHGDWDDDGAGQGNGGYGNDYDDNYGGADDNGYDGSNSGGYSSGGGRGMGTGHHSGGHHSGGGHGMGGDWRTSRHDGEHGGGMGGGGALSNGGADQVTGYNAGFITGNQVSSVIQAPIDVSGNAIALFGFANAASGGGAGAFNESASATEADQISGFNAGFLSGNQVSSVVQVPVSVCGNAIAVLGFANASCVGGAGAFNGGGGGWDNGGHRRPPADDDDPNGGSQGDPYYDPSGSSTGARPMASGHGAHKATTKAAKKANNKKHADENGSWGARGHHGTSTGNGSAAGAYGGSGSGDYDYGDGSGSGQGNGNGNGGGSWGGSCGPDQVTGFNGGILSGNQFSNVAQVPIDISGNAISVLGFANARSGGGAVAVNC